MIAEIPRANIKLHLCLRAPNGIVMIDTCPTREAFEAFARSEGFRALRQRHGLPEPSELADHPWPRAIVELSYALGSTRP
jgi:hypothetical protein